MVGDPKSFPLPPIFEVYRFVQLIKPEQNYAKRVA